MTTTSSATPFSLGVYIGNPDNSSVANEALFENTYSSFTQQMGAAPQYLDFFIDQNQTVANWAGNAQWEAASAAASPDAKGAIPVIALPLSSNAPGAGTSDQQFQSFASGQHDSDIAGIVKAWAQQGFANLVFRPGWEMNLTGPTYAGDSAQSQADWVKAFQHVYTVLHQAAAADGVNVSVVWNPGITNYSNALATTNLYPGDAYVDVIGADMYSDIYPFSDGGTTPTYHDWATGQEDTSVAQFIANPVNRAHYWTDPAGTKWSTDSSGGHSLSLENLIQFAQAHGKAFAVPETGAGNSNSGTDVTDDAAFPQWLAQELVTAQAGGEKVSFVNIWDSNGGGNYAFTGGAKPLEAAAWAKYFGGTPVAVTPTPTPTVTPAPTPTPVTPAPVTPVTPVVAPTPAITVGTGNDTLALQISEDAWNGDAAYTISVDGKQVGGTLTAVASHAAGQTQTVNVLGSFAAGSHTVAVDFLNDAWGGTASTDRNLYVDGSAIDGTAVQGGSLVLLSGGSQGFSFAKPGAVAAASTDTLDVHVSEDAWQGDAQFTISIDGAKLGGVYTATASHAAGATQDVSIAGSWGSGSHTVGIAFINDAWGGSASTDRNLYVDQVSYDGKSAAGAPATLLSNGSVSFAVSGATSTTPSSTTTPATVPPAATPATTAVTLGLSEDAWQGDAQYSVAIDGVSVGRIGTVTASHALGQSQSVILQEVLAAGTHDLALSFLNDAWGGSATTDRNLYVTGIQVNGTAVAGAPIELYNTSTDHFQFVVPAS